MDACLRCDRLAQDLARRLDHRHSSVIAGRLYAQDRERFRRIREAREGIVRPVDVPVLVLPPVDSLRLSDVVSSVLFAVLIRIFILCAAALVVVVVVDVVRTHRRWWRCVCAAAVEAQQGVAAELWIAAGEKGTDGWGDEGGTRGDYETEAERRRRAEEHEEHYQEA